MSAVKKADAARRVCIRAMDDAFRTSGGFIKPGGLDMFVVRRVRTNSAYVTSHGLAYPDHGIHWLSGSRKNLHHSISSTSFAKELQGCPSKERVW